MLKVVMAAVQGTCMIGLTQRPRANVLRLYTSSGISFCRVSAFASSFAVESQQKVLTILFENSVL